MVACWKVYFDFEYGAELNLQRHKGEARFSRDYCPGCLLSFTSWIEMFTSLYYLFLNS